MCRTTTIHRRGLPGIDRKIELKDLRDQKGRVMDSGQATLVEVEARARATVTELNVRQRTPLERIDRKHSTQDEPTQDASVAAENDGAKVATGELPNCSPPTGADSPCAAVDEVQEAPPKAEVNSAGTMEMDAEIMRLREEIRLLRIDTEQSYVIWPLSSTRKKWRSRDERR